MKTQDLDKATHRAPPARDYPHRIKWILLIILLVLIFLELYSGEYKRIYEQAQLWGWLVILIKIILLIGIIILMIVQRSLKCQITDPTGCTEERPDPVKGILYVSVKGSATGGAFGYYTVEIQKDGISYPGIVSYPGGTVNGTTKVVNGDLATIDTTALSDAAYIITLRVFPSGSGAAKVCTKTFTLLKVGVWIDSVENILPSPNIFDEDAKLAIGGIEQSFGGYLTILGSAYIYECSSRKVARVEMRYAPIPSGGSMPMQPANNNPIPADWPVANQLLAPLVYDPAKYYSWTRIGMAPTYLLNTWGTCKIGGTTYPRLIQHDWNSRNATGGSADGGDYFKLLLATEDTGASVYYDTQKIWIDNHRVKARIIAFQREVNGAWVSLVHCSDIYLSWKKLRVIGIAWDALINPLYPATRPNDNFDHYDLTYVKQFVASANAIPINPTADKPLLASTLRVPDPVVFPLNGSIPGVANADLLAEWDLNMLDAGKKPSGVKNCPDPPAPDQNKLYRGCECTYTIRLNVHDFTTGTEWSNHNVWDIESVKIINDIPSVE
jgi:hypothetical protein